MDSVKDAKLGILCDHEDSFNGTERCRAPDLDGQGDQRVTTSGFWEAVVESGGNTRLFAAEMSNFGSHMVGWKVIVNTKRPSYHTIISVAGNDELVVEGDLTDPVVMAQAGDWFRVITPYTLDSATGDQHEDVWKHHPREGMWAGYRFMPPEVGSQSGNNQKGSYYAWNRTYDTHTGRWTTPDPAASPWWNLQDYVGGRPLDRSDPSGLQAAGNTKDTRCRTTIECLNTPPAGHDRPGGGVRLRPPAGCEPKLLAYANYIDVPEKYKEGVDEAIQKRLSYIRSHYNAEPTPSNPDQEATVQNSGLGGWILRLYDKAVEPAKRRHIGFMAAFVVVMEYCDNCPFKEYRHERMEDGVWVNDAPQVGGEGTHLSAERKVKVSDSEFNYRARADSVGAINKSAKSGDTVGAYYRLRGILTVTNARTGNVDKHELEYGEVGYEGEID